MHPKTILACYLIVTAVVFSGCASTESFLATSSVELSSFNYERTHDLLNEESRAFAYDQAFRYVDEQLRVVPVSNEPWRGPAVFVAHTHDYLLQQIDDECPNCGPVRPYISDLIEADHLALPRALERMNIFSDVEIVRSDSIDEIEPPKNGYLLWADPVEIEFSQQRNRVYIKSACETEWTNLNPPLPTFGPSILVGQPPQHPSTFDGVTGERMINYLNEHPAEC